MTLSEAEKIIQDFGQVQEVSSSIGLAIPEQFLPYPKEEIKLAFVSAYKLADDEGRNILKGAFIYLATYVPIDEAIKVFRYTNYLTNTESAHESDAGLRDEWKMITDKINREMQEYSKLLG